MVTLGYAKDAFAIVFFPTLLVLIYTKYVKLSYVLIILALLTDITFTVLDLHCVEV